MKFVGSLKELIEVDFAVFSHGTAIDVVVVAVLHLVVGTSFKGRISVIFQGSRRLLDVSEEFVKHGFGLIGFVDLLLNLLKL